MAERRGWGALHRFHLSPAWEIPLSVIALDLVIYSQHVLFHAVPALWRLHRVHHADLDFDVTTGLRFHTIEILLSFGLKLAAILVLGPSPWAVLIFEVLLNATSMFNHSNVRMPMWCDLRISLVPFAEQVVVDGYIPYNAEISVAEQEVDRNRLLLKRAQVEPFPNITVNAGYMRQYTAIENIGIINLSAPLPLWNKNQGNISAAVANVTKASANVATIRNTIAKQMADARGRYRAADQLVVRYEEKIIPLARESVKVIQEAFDQGQFDFLRLLQAQRALIESQLGYISALETRWMTAAELAGLAQVEAFP
ncbi:MAG: TolC family protein [Planctomycetaceae bacterium]|nr:TolC family protein [Planctomycetaceae bacterium]